MEIKIYYSELLKRNKINEDDHDYDWTDCDEWIVDGETKLAYDETDITIIIHTPFADLSRESAEIVARDLVDHLNNSEFVFGGEY